MMIKLLLGRHGGKVGSPVLFIFFSLFFFLLVADEGRGEGRMRREERERGGLGGGGEKKMSMTSLLTSHDLIKPDNQDAST